LGLKRERTHTVYLKPHGSKADRCGTTERDIDGMRLGQLSEAYGET